MKSMICNHLIRPAMKWLRVVPPDAASGKESRQAGVEFHIRHYFTKSLLIKFKLMAMVGTSKTGKLTRSTSYASAIVPPTCPRQYPSRCKTSPQQYLWMCKTSAPTVPCEPTRCKHPRLQLCHTHSAIFASPVIAVTQTTTTTTWATTSSITTTTSSATLASITRATSIANYWNNYTQNIYVITCLHDTPAVAIVRNRWETRKALEGVDPS
jgi:hypothetical protein